MQIKFSPLLVDDQDAALRFYTQQLGFETCADIPMGPYRFLTVRSPEGLAGVELVLQPLGFEPARVYQRALYEAGMPAAAFTTADIAAEYERLRERGVRFREPPRPMGPIIGALFEDGCGNLIHLVQPLVTPESKT